MFPFWLSPLIIVAIILGAYYGVHDSHSSSSPSTSSPSSNPTQTPTQTQTHTHTHTRTRSHHHSPAPTQGKWPFPEPCSGVCSGTSNPSIVVSPNGTYYRVGVDQGLYIAVADAIEGPWRNGSALMQPTFKLGNFPTGQNHVWAPDLVYINGLYYLYYTIYSKLAIGSHNLMDIGVATATDPLGPYTDHGSIGIPYGDGSGLYYSIIGGNLLFGNPPYMAWGSYQSGLFGIEMQNPPLLVAHGGAHNARRDGPENARAKDNINPHSTIPPALPSEAQIPIDGRAFRNQRRATAAPPFNPKNPYTTSIPGHVMYPIQSTNITKLIADQPIHVGSQTNRTEGPFLIQYPAGTGYYYLFYSRGNCCPAGRRTPWGELYRIQYCRASHVSGPYYDEAGVSCLSGKGGTLLLASHDNIIAPGAMGVLVDKDKGPIIYYQYHDSNRGYGIQNMLFAWNYLSFENGWFKIVASQPQTNTTTTK